MPAFFAAETVATACDPLAATTFAPTLRSSSNRNSTGSPSCAVFELISAANFSGTSVPSLSKQPLAALQPETGKPFGIAPGESAAPCAASTAADGFPAC